MKFLIGLFAFFVVLASMPDEWWSYPLLLLVVVALVAAYLQWFTGDSYFVSEGEPDPATDNTNKDPSASPNKARLSRMPDLNEINRVVKKRSDYWGTNFLLRDAEMEFHLRLAKQGSLKVDPAMYRLALELEYDVEGIVARDVSASEEADD